jgi:serine/threonine-protein kinase HipA
VELDIWLNDALVARTISTTRGSKVRIVYSDQITEIYPAETPLLSCSLPVPGPGEPARSRAFLEGLLPEGRALSSAAAQVRGVRLVNGSPETTADAVLLLAEFGRECAGAVIVLPSGHAPPTGGRFELLSEPALAQLIHDLPQHPLGTDLDRNIRMSLAGAQQKFLLTRIDGEWWEPLDGAPSTHIIKPTVTWPYSAHNEALILALGRACGLTSYDAWIETMGDTTVLVAERYDREVADGKIIRRHQEDMCQATGIRPDHKYQIGRPSERMARLLREFADAPGAELSRLFEQVAFRAIVGDEDGHGKNYSLLLDNGRVSLAPLYDSLCTLIYRDLSGTMASKIGNQLTLAKVDRAALIAEAQAMGIPKSQADASLNSLADRIRLGIANLDDQLTEGWPSDSVTDIVEARVERLLAGKALGGPARRPPRVARTLDAETESRELRPPPRPAR